MLEFNAALSTAVEANETSRAVKNVHAAVMAEGPFR
jgi:hypothetical protein